MRPVVLQHATGAEYIQLLEMVRVWHSNIFSDCDYRAESDELEILGRHPMWHKVAAIRRAIASMVDGQIFLWMDADAVAVKRFGVESVLGEGFCFGGVENVEEQFNAGVMFCRVCPAIRRLWDFVWERGPDYLTPHHDQGVINHCLRNMSGVRFQRLCPRYNWYPRARKPCSLKDVVIRGWHQLPRDEFVRWFGELEAA